jgi:saccharopine dehydrogenase (NAD+, L-lysine-forming)
MAVAVRTTTKLWMRHEVRRDEHRAVIVPADARALIAHGAEITVEDSPTRCFAAAEYVDAGCAVGPAGSWTGASRDCYVIGLKELPRGAARLTQRHIFFGHAYKGQVGGRELLQRFATAEGSLLDLEHLVDDRGRRLAAFGYWAGYVGAALGVLQLRGRLCAPLRPLSKEALDRALTRTLGADVPRVLVIGALGRCGLGARAALQTAGISPTCWDAADTPSLDRAKLLDHDLLVNAVVTLQPVRPFLTTADVADPVRRLRVIADVTCDVTSDCNVLPIYDDTTDWEQPVRRIRGGEQPLDIIAIDNLPSLLPVEASVDFSAQLLPHLLQLGTATSPWLRCLEAFHDACDAAALQMGSPR